MTNRAMEYLNVAVLCLTALVLVALQWHLVGWVLWILGAASLLWCRPDFRKYLILVYICLALLGITPITTDISYQHILLMGIPLILAIAIPFGVSRLIYHENVVRFQFHHGRRWFKSEIFYVVLTAVVAYFVLPFFLANTGSYLNWTVEPGFSYLFRLFLGTNFLGIWDELFFISTVLGILRRYFTFTIANLAQAVLFTSFLYELGFRGWGFVMIFGFALLQGYIFKKTESLFYVITIHLTLDLILYLALIHAYYPEWVPIFVT